MRAPVRRMASLLGLSMFSDAALAAGGAMPPLVQDVGYSLALAGMLVLVFSLLKVPSIAAYVVAGVVAGPIGLSLVSAPDSIHVIAELGLILLLFVIGLELDLRKVLASGRIIVLSGLLQVPLTLLLGLGAAKLILALGFPAMASGFAALYIGIALAASSTLIVVKLFQESFQLDTTSGRVSLALLIFQDIWAIVIIALQANFDEPQLAPILFSFAGIAALVLVAMLLARFVLGPLFGGIARSPELLLVGGIGWCFVVVFLGSALGQLPETLAGAHWPIQVGAGMSALIAGATIASLPYSADVIGKVGVVKDFFVVLFFVGLGMMIPVPEGPAVLLLGLVIAVLAILVRYLVFFPLLYWNGLDRNNAFVVATRLAQVSEFSLVIAYGGLKLGHIETQLSTAIIFAFVLTALVTPLLFRLSHALYRGVEPLLGLLGFREPSVAEAREDAPCELALLGFHRLASSLLHDLERDAPDLLPRTLVVDFNAHLHAAIASTGARVRYGDLSEAETLQHVGIDKARVVVITVQDDVLRGTSNRRLVQAVRHLNPTAAILANAIDLAESARLYAAGADYVYVPRVAGARELGAVIRAAQAGTLSDFRRRQDADEVPIHARDEIIP